MQQNTKWLFIAFSVLLVIVIGEVIYYFFILTPQRNNTQNVTIQNQNQNQSPQESINTIPPSTAPAPIDSPQNDSAVKYINSFSKDSVTSSRFINTYRGKISAIENSTGPYTDRSYNVTITYVSVLKFVPEKNPELTAEFFFTEEDLQKMVVVQRENGTEQTITYNDLKMNDSITIEETMDTLQSDFSNVFTYKIIKE